MSIAALADLKGYLDITKTSQDTFLQGLLDSVSLQVERYTAKRFSPTPALVGGVDSAAPVAVTVPVDRSWARIPHARQVNSVTVGGSPLAFAPGASGYLLDTDPTLRDPFFRYIQFGDTWLPGATAVVTGRFGIWPVPPDVNDAVLMMAARRYRERDASYADQILLADGAMVNYFKQFPVSVRAIIDSYCELGV